MSGLTVNYSTYTLFVACGMQVCARLCDRWIMRSKMFVVALLSLSEAFRRKCSRFTFIPLHAPVCVSEVLCGAEKQDISMFQVCN